MAYKDVEVKCFFCDVTVNGNQRFMTGGRNLPSKVGRIPNRVRARPEHHWEWNGLSEYINGERKSFEFYLCPCHTDQKHYRIAFNWAQEQIDKQKVPALTLPFGVGACKTKEVNMEKGKDTVMSNRQIERLPFPTIRHITEAQAEISFSAGRQEGIREVVEWGEEPCPHVRLNLKRECDICWQALKEEV